MLRRMLSIILTGLMLSTAAVSAVAKNSNEAAPAEKAAKARAAVQKLGVGEKARVEVRLRDNTKLKGYVSASDEDSFTVTDAKTGANTTVAYAEAAQVKKPGGGLSPTTWAIIGGAAAAAAVIVAKVVIYPILCDGGAGC